MRFNDREGIRILCLGAHSDDIEIGCGGTLLRLLQECKRTDVHWVVFSSDSRREKEARSSARVFLKDSRKNTIVVKKFRNGFFPFVGGEIKDFFEETKKRFSPDVIFTHYRSDLHQDHRVVSELTWNTYRNHFILEYEIPKYDGDFGTPNFFVPLESSVCQRKIDTILSSFETQGGKHWLTEDLLRSILRIRGMECVSPTRYAEGFHCRKAVLD